MIRLRRLGLMAVAVLFAASMTLSGAFAPFAAFAAAAPAVGHHAMKSDDGAVPCHGDHQPAPEQDSHDANAKSCCGVACHTAVPVETSFVPPTGHDVRGDPVAGDAMRAPAPPRIEHPPRPAGHRAG